MREGDEERINRVLGDEYPEEQRGDCWEEKASRPGAGAAAPKPPPGENKSPPRPVLIQLATVPREPVQWLMDDWLPDGALTLLDGDPGLGKSTITLDVAARLSRGWALPPLPGGQLIRDPVGVLLLGAEDSLKSTVGPRLDAA